MHSVPPLSHPHNITRFLQDYTTVYVWLSAARVFFFFVDLSCEHPASRHNVGVCAQVTNASMAGALGMIAVAGPTHDQQPAFRWSTSGFPDGHEGQPDLWDFAPFACTWGKGDCKP
ncbi:hypothetical protein HPB48_026180 [Haemaphysalis longicornis]|uniref:Phospholipase B-like n=1 Tax=Haemaphysalis longicornis TaxID=44386 RepID=A0A9J6H905_HAELO|nr:hypothetical protein HPB48_026180 [Haemaphysalis longicornis]